MKINIKPLSVNEARQGKRFKSPKYRRYEQIVLMMLPKIRIDVGIKISISIERLFSNKLSDIDNCAKPLLDCMQKARGFNDNQIYILNMTKRIVPKGNEGFILNIGKIEDESSQ